MAPTMLARERRRPTACRRRRRPPGSGRRPSTAIASAVDSEPDGVFSVTLPSRSLPDAQLAEDRDARARSPRATFLGAGRSRLCAISPTRLATIATSSSMSSGSGSTTTLKRRFSAEDSSLTPLSRLLAVAMTLKPRAGVDGSVQLRDRHHLFRQHGDQRVLHVASPCASAPRGGRACRPPWRASSGVGTSASRDGPLASSCA